MMDKMEKAKAGMPQKTSIEISRMIVEEEWQGETGDSGRNEEEVLGNVRSHNRSGRGLW